MSGLDEAPRDLSGEMIGDFRIVRKLGQGGMGEVYLAEQVSLGRKVALKVLRQDLVLDPAYLARFLAEARAVAPISHPNIVSVYASGQQDGVHYMALEYVRGLNLKEYLHRRGPLPLRPAVHVLRKVAAALARAHEEGIIHRDIKPENVLLTRRGEVKVADFGLARQVARQNVSLTQSGVTMGTPLYMSPEQIQGQNIDVRSDIYSFGVTVYHLLAGEPPYRGETAMAVAIQHMQGSATPLAELRPDLPRFLIQLIQRMMARRPEDRYQSALDLMRDLDQLPSELLARTGEQEESDFELANPVEQELLAAGLSGDEIPISPTRLAPTVDIETSRPRCGVWKRIWQARAWLALVLLAWMFGSLLRPFPPLIEAALAPPPPTELPPTDHIKTFAASWIQLRYALSAEDADEREARLWAVVTKHLGAERDSVIAATYLYDQYVTDRNYPKARAVAQFLSERENREQQLVGRLLAAMILAREGKLDEARAAYTKVLQAPAQLFVPADTFALLERELVLTLLKAGSDGKPDPRTMQAFRSRVVPLPTRN